MIIKDHKRLFFALWPDAKTRQRISRSFLSSSFSKNAGRHFNVENLHLTLHFLGHVSDDQYHCMSGVATKVKFNAFDLTLNYFGVFAKPKVFWMGIADTPPALKQLHNDLGNVLTPCGYQVDERAFTPHVTLMRKIKLFEIHEKPQPVNWRINRFALVESVSVMGGVIYKPIKIYDA